MKYAGATLLLLAVVGTCSAFCTKQSVAAAHAAVPTAGTVCFWHAVTGNLTTATMKYQAVQLADNDELQGHQAMHWHAAVHEQWSTSAAISVRFLQELQFFHMYANGFKKHRRVKWRKQRVKRHHSNTRLSSPRLKWATTFVPMLMMLILGGFAGHQAVALAGIRALWLWTAFSTFMSHASKSTTHRLSIHHSAAATPIKQASCLTRRRRTKRCLRQRQLRPCLLRIKAFLRLSKTDEAVARAQGLLHRVAKQKGLPFGSLPTKVARIVVVPWLLSASGDVEENPGPPTTRKPRDLQGEFNALIASVAHKAGLLQALTDNEATLVQEKLTTPEALYRVTDTQLTNLKLPTDDRNIIKEAYPCTDSHNEQSLHQHEKGPPPPGGSGAGIFQAPPTSAAAVFQQVAARLQNREERRTGSVQEALARLFGNEFNRGDPVELGIQLRAGRLDMPDSPPEITDLGVHLKWVGRERAVQKGMGWLSSMYTHWKHKRQPFTQQQDDAWKEGVMRLAVVGAPGTGKSSFCSRFLYDVVAMYDQLKAAGQQPVDPALDELIPLLKRGLEHHLYYWLDFQKCGKTQYEKSGSCIQPAQSLALRLLWAICRKTGQSFLEFLETLMTRNPLADVTWLLGHLRSEDVIKQARASLLPAGTGRVAWHFVKDEVQHGFEYKKALQQHPDSNAMFLANLLSAQGNALRFCDDFLVFMYSGTHMDFTDPHLTTASGDSKSGDIFLNLISDEDSQSCLCDLQDRVGLGRRELTQALKLLSRTAAGNPRHLVALVTAAAGFIESSCKPTQTRGLVQRTKLVQLFQSERGPEINSVFPQALSLVLDRHPKASDHLNKWLAADDGRVIMRLLAHTITLKPVDRNDVIQGEDWDEGVELQFGMLEGTGVIALHELTGSKPVVVLPPLVFWEWKNRAVRFGWADQLDNIMLDMYGSEVTSRNLETSCVNMILSRLHAFKHWLGYTECQLDDVLPTVFPPDLAELTFKLPDFSRVVELRGYTNEEEFVQQLESATKEGGYCAFLGPGNEPKPDFWVFLVLTDGRVVVLQGQVKSHQYAHCVETRALMYKESLKQFKINEDQLLSIFLYFTDADAPDVPTQNAWGFLLDAKTRDIVFTPLGALKREYMEHLAGTRRTKHRKIG